MQLDRVASPTLLAGLRDGVWAWIPALVRLQSSPRLLDLRFRSNPAANTCQAVLYFGERAALRLREAKHTSLESPEKPLGPPSPEGWVQAALCATPDYAVIDRECAFRFTSTAEKAATLAAVAGELRAVVDRFHEAGNGTIPKPPRLGQELDALAVAPDGALEVIEVKAGGATGAVGWAPAQVGFYARLFEHWLAEHPGARRRLEYMLRQRVDLQMAPAVELQDPVRIRAVIAVGEPFKSEAVAKDRAESLQRYLRGAGVGWGDLEARKVSVDGSTSRLDWFSDWEGV
jgi:hypothetical protein